MVKDYSGVDNQVCTMWGGGVDRHFICTCPCGNTGRGKEFGTDWNILKQLKWINRNGTWHCSFECVIIYNGNGLLTHEWALLKAYPRKMYLQFKKVLYIRMIEWAYFLAVFSAGTEWALKLVKGRHED